MIVLKDIETKTFDKAFVGGYSPNEVDDFLDEVYNSFKSICDENEELKQKLTALAAKLEEYKKDEENIKNALLDAQKIKNSIKDELEQKNHEIIDSANQDAEIIISKAQKDAEKILANANFNAQVKDAQSKNKVNQSEKELEYLQKEVSDFKKKIFDLYKEHLELLNNVPSFENDEISKPTETNSNEENSDEDISTEKEEIVVEESTPEEISKAVDEIKNTSKENDDEKTIVVEAVNEKLYKKEIKSDDLKFGVDYEIETDFDAEDEYIDNEK